MSLKRFVGPSVYNQISSPSAALKAAGSEGSEGAEVTDSDPPTLTVNQAPPQTEAGNHGNITVETAQPESCE